jgi:hypothetical protein
VKTDIFTTCFDHFIKFVKHISEEPVLLALDALYTHTHTQGMKNLLTRQEKTHLNCQLPHTSYHMQPLDARFMFPLETHYGQETRDKVG